MTTEQIVMVPLTKIFVSHNPRCPAEQLVRNMALEGYDGWAVLDLVRQLALSHEAGKKAEYCRLLESYDWRTAEGEIDPESIVAIAESLRTKMQIQPIVLRRYTHLINGEHQERYAVVVGERRLLATAYNHAKHGTPAAIKAVVKRMTVAKARDLAWEENRRRRAPSLLETANYFHAVWEEHRGKPNQESGRKFTMKDVASSLGEDYQEFRRTEALVFLPDKDKQRLADGKIGKVAAQEMALRIKKGEEGNEVADKKKNRRRLMTLREVESLFDQTPRNKTNYLQALADVMQISLEKAVRESDSRLAKQEAAA